MKLFYLLTFFFLLGFLSLPQELRAQSAPAVNPSGQKNPSTKPTVYFGDPALKRGVELGYDQGVKAGKADKAEKKKADPSRHPEYKAADTKHRSEYGSRASFVRGYQMGFTKGYTFSYTGKSVPLKAPAAVGGTGATPEASPTSPKSKSYDPSEDAL